MTAIETEAIKEVAARGSLRLGAARETGVIQRIPVESISLHLDNHRDPALADQAKLQALADSMAAHGLLQPIMVQALHWPRRDDAILNTYKLIYGHRRLAAAQLLGQ